MELEKILRNVLIYLVNLKFVTKIDDFTLYLGSETLAISRSKKKSFLKDVADFLGGSI